MDCEEGNLMRCPKLGLLVHLDVPRKTSTKPLCFKRRLEFDDISLIRKRCRGGDELGFQEPIAGGKAFPEIEQVSDINEGITLSLSFLVCGLPALFRTDKEEKTEERHEPTSGSGMLKNREHDEPQVLHLHSSLLQSNVASASEHTGKTDSEGKQAYKEKVIESVMVGPPTPLPIMRKRAKSGIKSQKVNLAEVRKLASDSPYYTRSINKQVLNAIKSMESEVVTFINGGRQLKTSDRRVSRKSKKNLSVKSKVASKAWQELMKKATVESCDTMLEKDESNSAEFEPLIFNGKVESFISKVGTIQGQRLYLPWKGSVLDSIIGALLTQRTSDNFSSSAFMSLGVSFPQDSDCDTYSRHHRMLRDQRSNGYHSRQNQDVEGSKMILGVESRIHFDKNKKETLIKGKVAGKGIPKPDWNTLRTQYSGDMDRERSKDAIDYVDWYAVGRANVKDISNAIMLRGMNKKLAKRIKDILIRLMKDHGNLDLEWVREVPPPQAKEFLLSIYGLGLKSAQCVQLLTLKQPAFPVDVNVARVTVRLGWVPFPPDTTDTLLMSLLEEKSKLHDLINQYLWPRLCKLEQKTLYELHYHMITFGKVFCTKQKPRCSECPMRKECKYYAGIDIEDSGGMHQYKTQSRSKEAKGEMLKTRCKRQKGLEKKDPECLSLYGGVQAPRTPLKDESLMKQRSQRKKNKQVSLIKRQPKKSRTRTQHFVYELPDWHPILEKFDDRDADDLSPYLLVVWESGNLLPEEALSSCHSRVARSQTVPGTVLIPYRTALRGNFPLNATFFQTNEVFADQHTSQVPIDVRLKTLQQLQQKTLYCGSDLFNIVKDLSANEVESLFNEGYICTRGFNRETCASVTLERTFHMKSQASKRRRKQP